jgi:hypothetical protein
MIELLFKHWQIVEHQTVEQGQVTIVIWGVWAWVDLVYDWVLTLHAHDVLNRPTLVVLSAPCLKKVIGAHEPVKDCLVAVARTLKQTVFTEIVSLSQSLQFEVSEELLQHLEVLGDNCKLEGSLSQKIGQQTPFFALAQEQIDDFVVLVSDSPVEWRVSFD